MLRLLAGGTLFGEATGTAPATVLALHGWGRSHQDFRAVLGPTDPCGPDDGRPLDAVAPDLPGFGATPPPPEPWGSAEYAACVTDLLGAMAGPAVVVGHSFGGRVAVQLAATSPGSVRALVLTGAPLIRPPGSRRRPPAPYRALRTLHRLGLVGERRMEAARQRYGSPDYRAAHGVMRQVLVRTLAETYDDQLAAIACPVHLVWGDDDAEVPLVVAERLAERLAGATLTVCPGAGHLTPLTAPRQLRRAVLDSLP